MISKNKIYHSLQLIMHLVRYNLKIIFANKFIYFLGVACLMFLIVTVLRLLSDTVPTIAAVYNLLLLPGILLVAYPTIFGIQNDADAQMLEILFGVPNYRYKVWLVRMVTIYGVVFLVLLGLCVIETFVLLPFNIFEMTYQLLFPIFFLGCLGFLVSTLVRNGNGTAVVMIIIGLAFWILSGELEENQWNLFLNPFLENEDLNATIWANTVTSNRFILAVGSVLTLLFGLLNMQRRERFM